MTLDAPRRSTTRKTASLGVPWEEIYGYSQAIQVGNSIFVSGQVSHDSAGEIIGAAPLDDDGKPRDFEQMALQMQIAYANAKKVLTQFGAGLDDVVEETLFVLDVDAAFAVAGKIRRQAYDTDKPRCASNLIGVSRLAFPTLLIEIALRAEMPLRRDA